MISSTSWSVCGRRRMWKTRVYLRRRKVTQHEKVGVGVDLVVDTRETWKEFASRVWNFHSPPLIERAELPLEKQPHQTIYGKLACYVNGIDPYPPSSALPTELVLSRGNKSETTTFPVSPEKQYYEEEKRGVVGKAEEKPKSGRKSLIESKENQVEYVEAKDHDEEEARKKS
eukprot:TRINITY_DN2500_c0_g3_i1.p2 TRINITY_DN2500_c0_g3~~TRINITY_DN2500_c0_g3_i1.p2  ORF type:complete len:172 (-),score=36.48 TRINITY_DN2500_c0_g3_i1:138-653(-)